MVLSNIIRIIGMSDAKTHGSPSQFIPGPRRDTGDGLRVDGGGLASPEEQASRLQRARSAKLAKKSSVMLDQHKWLESQMKTHSSFWVNGLEEEQPKQDSDEQDLYLLSGSSTANVFSSWAGEGRSAAVHKLQSAARRMLAHDKRARWLMGLPAHTAEHVQKVALAALIPLDWHTRHMRPTASAPGCEIASAPSDEVGQRAALSPAGAPPYERSGGGSTTWHDSHGGGGGGRIEDEPEREWRQREANARAALPPPPSIWLLVGCAALAIILGR